MLAGFRTITPLYRVYFGTVFLSLGSGKPPYMGAHIDQSFRAPSNFVVEEDLLVTNLVDR